MVWVVKFTPLRPWIFKKANDHALFTGFGIVGMDHCCAMAWAIPW